ncbi:MAG: hypothetical protein M0Z36_01200 [Thermaerobacter sp.]|nr:hypothetical protein [Thermaerobacter sp.]
MNTPLRWAYPISYKRLESFAREAGVHSYEYQALVDTAVLPEPLVILQRGGDEWTCAFSADDLAQAAEPVLAFFADAMRAMAESAEAAYKDFMHQREV